MVGQSKVEIKVIRVDEAPVLFAVMAKLRIGEIIDGLLKRHGNWAGELSIGEVISGWLVYVLSTNDHRMNQVEEWVERRQPVYELCLGHKLRRLDFNDDRLGVLLDKLSEAEVWNAFEAQLNKRMIRVYALESEQIRLDATTISTYTAVNEEGLLAGAVGSARPTVGDASGGWE
jgi:transposase